MVQTIVLILWQKPHFYLENEMLKWGLIWLLEKKALQFHLVKYVNWLNSLCHGESLSFINLFLLLFSYIFTILDFEKAHAIYKSIKCVFVFDPTGKVYLSP